MLEEDVNKLLAEQEEMHEKAHKIGVKAALGCGRTDEFYISGEIPQCFGEKWTVNFDAERRSLKEKYADTFDDFMTFSIREYVYGCHRAAHLRSESNKRRCRSLNVEYQATPEENPVTYPDTVGGWAESLYFEMCDLEKHKDLLEGISVKRFPREKGAPMFIDKNKSRIDGIPDSEDILKAMAIIWFIDAASAYPDNVDNAFNLLFEANNAIARAHGIKVTLQNRSNAATSNAHAKADKSKKDKDIVRQCWMEWKKKPKRYKNKSQFIMDMTNKCEVAPSYRTIERWIAEIESKNRYEAIYDIAKECLISL